MPGKALGHAANRDCGFLVESGAHRSRGTILSPTYPGADPSVGSFGFLVDSFPYRTSIVVIC